MPIPTRITVDPEPPTAGTYVVICYNWGDEPPVPNEIEELTLTITYGPVGVQPASVAWLVTREDKCQEVYLPKDATSAIVTDSSLWSADKAFPIQQP